MAEKDPGACLLGLVREEPVEPVAPHHDLVDICRHPSLPADADHFPAPVGYDALGKRHELLDASGHDARALHRAADGIMLLDERDVLPPLRQQIGEIAARGPRPYYGYHGFGCFSCVKNVSLPAHSSPLDC